VDLLHLLLGRKLDGLLCYYSLGFVLEDRPVSWLQVLLYEGGLLPLLIWVFLGVHEVGMMLVLRLNIEFIDVE